MIARGCGEPRDLSGSAGRTSTGRSGRWRRPDHRGPFPALLLPGSVGQQVDQLMSADGAAESDPVVVRALTVADKAIFSLTVNDDLVLG